MSRIKEPKQTVLYINSAIDRLPTDDMNSNKFTTFLSSPIRTFSGTINIRAQQVEVGNTWYSFPEYDSKIWFVEDTAGTPILRSVSIDTTRVFADGTTFASYLTTAFSNAGYGLSFAYTTTNGKLTVANNYSTKSVRLVSSYRYTNDPYVAQTNNDAHDRLGFNSDMISQVIAPSYALEADGILRLLRTNCCYLTCDLADGKSSATGSCPSPYKNASNIIARLPCSNFGFMSQVELTEMIQYPLSEKNLTAMTFSLLDDELEPLSTNGSPITFSLIITYM